MPVTPLGLADRARLEMLRLLPRSRPGRVSLGGRSVEYLDPLSLYFEYRDIFETGIYHFEPSREDPFIIDAGSFIGMATVYFKTVFPRSRILAFEPDPGAFEVLERNVRNNGLAGVRLIRAGLARSSGSAEFYPDGVDGGTLARRDGVPPVAIEVTRLSEHLTEPVDLLKMNVEGWEGPVFEDIEGKLGMVREIILEYHAFQSLPQTLGSILGILDRAGFRYLVADVPHVRVPLPFRMPEGYRCFNLVYARKMD